MTGAPLSYLEAAGPAASPLTRLAWGLGAVSVAVVAVIAILLAAAIWRRRSAPADPLSLEHAGGPGEGLRWIYVGLAVSVPVLAICTVWVLVVLGQVLHPGRAPALTLQVTAHQWWWEIRYLSPSGQAFTTANEIHIPVGEPVRVELTSPDVIHSFWVPKLAGKMDVIPGVKNVTWMHAAMPGLYRGECAEFCGLEHAFMAFDVVAQDPAVFAAWQARQLAPPAIPVTADATAGAAIFASRCAACHTVAGTPAGGLVGPDLSHVASRSSLAAGMIPNDAKHLSDWIADPHAIKPGVLMPKVPLSRTELAQLVAYLQTQR